MQGVSKLNLLIPQHDNLGMRKAQTWGWVKSGYCQVPKRTFDDAKKAAFEALNACPIEVIRRFINWAWHFMSAYHIGLTGKVAAWAVRKQKGHRSVSQGAMMHLDAIMNPS